jgi:phosphatidylglycerophosphate synthase
MSWLSEYRDSLKDKHAEEFLDVYLFRPIAFVIVKSFFSLPLSPNHYSFMSFTFGVISSVYFYFGNFSLGAFYFFLFAVLDCCDGMQARMKKNGTEFGRFIDGLVDYTVNIAAYICLGIGTKNHLTTIYGFKVWHLVIAAGASKALHSITFDHYLMEYLSYTQGKSGFLKQEIEMIQKKIELAKKDPHTSIFRHFALWTYLGFSKLQSKDEEGKILLYESKDYVEKNYLAISLWGMIGPAWHILFLILAFLFNEPNLLFLYAIVFGNIWMIIIYLYQKNIYKKIKKI